LSGPDALDQAQRLLAGEAIDLADAPTKLREAHGASPSCSGPLGNKLGGSN
jgi:hypothetical protein